MKPSFNTLTANYEYSRSNWENLLLSIQMQLFEIPKIFCCIFIAFLESTLNFEKMSLLTEVFLQFFLLIIMAV